MILSGSDMMHGSFLQRFFLSFALMLCANVVAAADTAEMTSFKKMFSSKLLKMNPKFSIESVQDSGMPNFYLVQVLNGPLIYAAKDGGHFFTGTLYRVAENSAINLTEQAAAQTRKSLMSELNPEEMIIFKPKSGYF